MLKMGFAEDVETILADTPDDKHVALFSATMPPQIRRISKKYLTDAGRDHRQEQDHDVGQHHPALPDRCRYPQKVDALTRILEVENFEGMIVFVRTKNGHRELAERLRARGFSAAAINGDIVQAQRERTINQLTRRQARHPGRHRRRRPRPRRRADQPRRQLRHPDRHRVLRAPHRPHRPRRPQRRRDLVRHPARAAPAQGDREGDPPAARPRCSCRASRTSTPPGSPGSTTRSPRRSATDRVDFFRDVDRRTTCSEHDVPEADVAAALAVVAQDDEPLLLEPEPEPSPARLRRQRERTGAGTASGRRTDRGDRPPRRDSGRAAAVGRADGDVPDRRRQAAQGRAAADRRRDRQRGRPATAATSGTSTSAPTTRSSSCRRTCRGRRWTRCERTRISGKLIELTPDGSGAAGAATERRKPRTKDRD